LWRACDVGSVCFEKYSSALRRPRNGPIGTLAVMQLAARMGRIGTETAFEAAARARALEATGRDVIHLEIGEPDFDTPRHIK